MMNSYMKFQTNSKKLQFGVKKCKKIHIGKTCDDFKCQTLTVDNWKEIVDEDSANLRIDDCFVGEEEMEDKDEEKYLGDIISNDGRNMKNIKARVGKGTGIVNNIMTKLDRIPFGKYYFEVAMILRNSLLVSSVLCNSEAWYNVTESELDYLETVDLMLLRKILNTPKSTPKEFMYLELGCIPFRDIIRKRRLLFLHYILNENPESLIHRFFKVQQKTRNKKDWVSKVINDLEELDINIDFDTLKDMKKSSFSDLLNKSIETSAFKRLENLKMSHTKVENVKHYMLQIRKYFQPSEANATKQEIQLIFKLRCRMTETKTNFKGLYDSYECDLCGKEDESQEHILKCTRLVNMNKDISEIPIYDQIFEGNTNEQVNIARIFQQNMKFKEKLLKGETGD